MYNYHVFAKIKLGFKDSSICSVVVTSLVFQAGRPGFKP